MKKPLILFLAAGFSASAASAALIYQDHFDNSNTATNGYLGNTLQDNDGNPMTESGTAVSWSTSGGWGWGGSNVQSNNIFAFPTAGQKYRIEWAIGPLTVTTASDQTWGDIRMQFSLTSKNSGQGLAPSTEFWSLTAGGLGVDIAMKGGIDVYANFVGKNDTQAVNSNPTNAIGQTNHLLNTTGTNLLAIELTSTGASLFVNGVLSNTTSLATWGLGGGVGQEFGNGFFLSTRGARVSNGLGTMSVDRVSVDLTVIPEPSSAVLGGLALVGMFRRRRV